ncbi:MAG: hypothetical protein FJZ05_01115 [Candidatus Nealsonbacteria bacterium]|nr:hypothetical protein [Candidatus Nealsonbacteria bacterium]
MLTESDRTQLIEILVKWKDELEEKINCTRRKSEEVVEAKDTYEKNFVGNGTEATQDLILITSYGKNLIRTLERVILRQEATKDFRFNAICPECNRDIVVSDLLQNPLMILCSDCQKRKNGIK